MNATCEIWIQSMAKATGGPGILKDAVFSRESDQWRLPSLPSSTRTLVHTFQLHTGGSLFGLHMMMIVSSTA
jgi:hypothetical protein